MIAKGLQENSDVQFYWQFYFIQVYLIQVTEQIQILSNIN